MSATDLFAIPDAVQRLGADLFLKRPLYKTAKPYTPIYINDDLYARFFGPAKSWDDRADTLAAWASVTLDESAKANGQAGWAYIDRQADPMGISLGGNEGSGRAYYMGGAFNVKGEKTPLATSETRRLSDGYLEAERGIWETMAANALAGELHPGGARVLAILDMDEMCQVVWREKPTRRVKIIRVDEGALDRISHVFYNRRPLALREVAENFGRMEGEKFIGRVLHGAWSAGNVSPHGHLIDFDTVCAVKGGNPQFSATWKYLANYFGFEAQGQLKILAALAADNAINADGTGFAELRAHFQTSYDNAALAGFVARMGFDDSRAVAAEFENEARHLFAQFTELARLIYPNFAGLSAREGVSHLIHVFDLAAFMRAYPLLRAAHEFTPARAVELAGRNTLLQNPFAMVRPVNMNYQTEKYYQENIADVLAPYVIHDAAALAAAEEKMAAFARSYHAFFTQAEQRGKPSAQRAYILNEDRLYLAPAFTPSYILANAVGRLPPRHINTLIARAIEASRRAGDAARADFRLFDKGCFYRAFDSPDTVRACFYLDEKPQGCDVVHSNDFTLAVNGENIPCTAAAKNGGIEITSAPLPISFLLADLSREDSLMSSDVVLCYKEKTLPLVDFLDL